MIQLLPLTEEALDELLPLARHIFQVSFAHQNTPEDMQLYMDDAFTPEEFLKELCHPDSLFFGAYDAGNLIGYLKLNVGAAQTDIYDANALEIERIYILPTHQGQGIGRVCLQKAVEVAQQRNLQYIWLGVWEHNPKAIEFYQRNGFVAFSSHVFLLGTDEQMDILMRREIR